MGRVWKPIRDARTLTDEIWLRISDVNNMYNVSVFVFSYGQSRLVLRGPHMSETCSKWGHLGFPFSMFSEFFSASRWRWDMLNVIRNSHQFVIPRGELLQWIACEWSYRGKWNSPLRKWRLSTGNFKLTFHLESSVQVEVPKSAEILILFPSSNMSFRVPKQ